MRSNRQRAAALLVSFTFAAGIAATGLTGTANAAPGTCTTSDATLTVFGINDFHGRLSSAAALFTPVEEARAAQGEDNVLTISQGDNIGASTLTSMVLDDKPTLDVMNAAALDVSTVGNHEFDKGWSDLSGRVASGSDFPYLGANVYRKGTTTVAAPLKAYEIFERAGVRVAVVGAVTAETPTMVSPAGVADLEFGNPVEAVNRATKDLLDGNDANGEADVVLASFHAGAANATSPGSNAGEFASIYNDVDPRVSAIFNGHTHQAYTWATAKGVPVIQAGQYGERIAKLEISLDASGKGVCKTKADLLTPPSTPGDTERLRRISGIVATATEEATKLTERQIGTATAAISTANDGTAGTRNTESPMLNLVAQMYAEVLGDSDEFIGVQNPGGTRDSWDAGPITYGEAAATLPFANSLFTTRLTGAQVKQVLEQQWQPDGASRPFLQLGLSKNVTYTYDESRPRGDRITSVSINGKPIDKDKRYTVGSGSFLIAGGDNFTALTEGVDTRDAGRADLEAWVSWVESKGTLGPDYTKRGVSAKAPESARLVEGGDALTFTFGATPTGATAPQSLDMFLGEGPKVSPRLANSSIVAYLGDTVVGVGTVTNGVTTVEVKLPRGVSALSGTQMLRFVVQPSGTEVFWPVTVVQGAGPDPSPSTSSPAPVPSPSATTTPPPRPDRPGLPRTGD